TRRSSRIDLDNVLNVETSMGRSSSRRSVSFNLKRSIKQEPLETTHEENDMFDSMEYDTDRTNSKRKRATASKEGGSCLPPLSPFHS
ncbi:hypothetical protein PENTCL1PPCAC_13352, partial [Pristionchus entomophagus]